MGLSWSWDRAPDLVVASLLCFIALFVLSAKLRSPANRLFGLFLFLVAGNFVCTALIASAGASYDSTHPYAQLGYYFLLYDPAVLALFVSIHPHRSGVSDRRWTVPLLFLLPTVLAIAHASDPSLLVRSPATAWRWSLFLYLGFSYLYCLIRLVLLASRAGTPLLQRQLQLLLLAFGVALIPRLGLLVIDLHLFADDRSWAATIAKILIAWSVLAGLAVLSVASTPKLRRGSALQALLAVASFLALITAIWIADSARPTANLFLVSLSYSTRWIIFSGFVAVAIAKHQMFEYQMPLREAFLLGALFLALVLGAFVLPGVLIPFPGDLRLRLSATDAAAIIMAGLAVASAPLFLRGIVLRRGSDESKQDHMRAGRLSAYRAVLETLAAEGRLQADREELRALRRNLAVSMPDHERLATLVRWQHASAHASAASPFSRFDVERPLGEGSWGQAYLAHDRKSGQPVVVKRLHSWAVDNLDARAALLREARILLRVEHPHVVRLLQVLDDPEPALVLEYVEGGSLESHLASGRRMAPPEATRIFGDVLQGLAALHEKGVIHRDLKPANVLLTAHGRAKLCDFGVALSGNLITTLRSAPGAEPPAGTIQYMSPEQARGDPLDERSDLYAVGAMLFRALTGQPHIDLAGKSEADAVKIIARGPEPKVPPATPPSVKKLLVKALARNARSRYSSAERMFADLQAFAPPPETHV